MRTFRRYLRRICPEDKLTVIEHLEELRRRLIISAVSAIIFSLAAYLLSDRISAAMSKAVGYDKFIYISPLESISADIKLSMTLGFVASLPVVASQGVAFIAPGLSKRNAKILAFTAQAAIILFYLGLIFGFRLILPAAFRFLHGRRKPAVEDMFSYGAFLSFAQGITIGSAMIFEVPLALIALVKSGIMSTGALKDARKHVILGICVIMAFISPTTDMVTLILLSAPAILLYELTLIYLRVEGSILTIAQRRKGFDGIGGFKDRFD